MKLVSLPPNPSIQPYPWASLEWFPREAAKTLQAFRAQTGLPGIARSLPAALERWSGQPARFELRRIVPCIGEPLEPRPRLLLRCAALPGSVLACIDPRLCLAITQQLSQRRSEPLDPLPPIEAPLLGAVAALASHLLDDVGLDTPIRIGWGHLPDSVGQRVAVEGTLHWGAGSYELVFVADLAWAPTRAVALPRDLQVLGGVPLALRLVVGRTVLSMTEVGRLTVGAAFMPGSDLWIDADCRGQVYLVAAEGNRGYPCKLVGTGKIVLGPRSVKSDFDELEPGQPELDGALGARGVGAQSLSDVLSEVPLVARIELGQVTLAASQFASLGPGDIVETDCRIGEPITLRIAGRAIATAELVNIDGQLGLRICELLTGETR